MVLIWFTAFCFRPAACFSPEPVLAPKPDLALIWPNLAWSLLWASCTHQGQLGKTYMTLLLQLMCC